MKTLRRLNPLVVLQAVGRVLVAFGLVAAYGWVCGVEHSSETPSGAHLFWIVPLILLGIFLSWLASDDALPKRSDESRTV